MPRREAMDKNVADYIRVSSRWFALCLPPAAALFGLYVKVVLLEERSNHNLGRIERLELDSVQHVNFDPDTGFTTPNIRAALNATIRQQTKGLLSREEFDRLIDRLVERNDLKR